MNSDKNQNEESKKNLKCRFFAQYWGQKVVAFLENLETIGVKEVRHEPRTVINFSDIDKCCLVLKQLTEISNEDAVSMFRGIGKTYVDAEQFLDDYKAIGFLEQSEADYLRSKGYAVPFMNYSVEDLISLGWVVIS